MTKRRRNTILAVLGLWAIALVLIAFGLFPQDFLRGYVELRLQTALGSTTRIRRLHVVPGKLRAEFEGLEAEGPTYHLTVPRGTLVVAPGFLWGQSLSLVLLTADSPVLELRPTPAGTPPRKPLEEALLIRDLHVSNGTVIYKTDTAGAFVFRGVSMSGSVGQGALTATSPGGEWQRTPDPVPIGPAQLQIRISPRLELRLDSLHGRVASSSFGVTGSLGRAAALAMDLQVKPQLDLADAALFADVPPLSGILTGDLHVTGPTDLLRVEGAVEGDRLHVGGWPIDQVAGTVVYEPESMTADVTASLLGGQASGDVHTDGQAVDARARFSGITVDRLRRQGVAIPAATQGVAAGNVVLSGPLGGTLSVDSHIDLSGAQDGMPLRAHLDAKGSLGTGGDSVDLRYALDARVRTARATGLPRWEEAHLVSHGTAKGALPPRVAGGYQGSVLVRTAGGARPVPVRGRFDNHGDATSFTMAAQAFGGTLDASGNLRGRFARRVDVAAHTIDLAQLDPAAAGRVDFTLNASGPLDRLSGSGNAALHDVIWNGTRVGEVTAAVTGTTGRGQVTLAAPEMKVTGQGTVTAQQFNGQLTLAGTPLDALGAGEGGEKLTGQAWGTVDVAVPFDRPDLARAEGRLDRVDVTQGTLSARTTQPFIFTYALRRVTVEDMRAEGQGFTLQADGSAGLEPGARIEGRARFTADLTRFTPPSGWTATGTAEGDVVLSGTRAAPRADGAVLIHDATLRDPRGATLQVADGRIVLQGDVAQAENLRATVPGGFVEITGRIPLASLLGDAQARAAGLTPGAPIAAHLHLDLDLAQVPNPFPLTLAGRAQGDVDLTGTRLRPRATGALRLTGVLIEGGAAPVIQIADGTIDLTGDSFTTPGLRATLGGGFVDLTGRVPLAALLPPEQAARFGFTGENADLRLAWEGVQAATVLESMRPGRPSALRALLAGDAHFAGNLGDWRAASGDVRLVPTAVQVQDVDLVVDPVSAHLTAGQLTTDGITVATDGGTFHADGSADLNQRTMDVSGEGQIELAALSPFLQDASLTGLADVDVHASGPISAPSPTGTIEIQDATLRLRDIRQPLSNIQALVIVEPGSAHLEQGTAQLGGGTVNMEGDIDLDGLQPGEAHVTAKGEGLGLRYPIGRGGRAASLLQELKARVNADLTLTGRPGNFLLTGMVAAERSLYDADIYLEEGLLAPTIPPAERQPSRFLQAVALNLSVFTENPFLVRNNLAQLEAEGSMQLRGDMDQPAPFGRFEIRRGGKVFIQGRELVVESGHLIYGGSLDPDIAVRATTVVPQSDGDIEATIVAEGPLMSPRLTLTSDPPMSEREIAELITTGRANNTGLSSGAWIVGEQAGGLLAGRFTRQVARQLQDLGFDQVDIQPELLAREGQPSARFTFGKQLTPQFRLVYSYSLSNPEARYYQGVFSLRPGRELSIKAQRREDGGYTYGIGQRLRFGDAPRRTREVPATERVELRSVRANGGLRELPDALEAAHAKAGRKVTYWDLLDDADRIRDLLVEQGYLEAVIDARFESDVAVFAGSLGPRHRWRVEGMTAPPNLDAAMHGALFEEEGTDKSRQLLLQELRKRGHLRGTVEVETLHEEGFHAMVFAVDPGPVLTADVQFPGALALSPAALLKASGGAAEIIARTADAEEAVRTAYRAHQYLAAKVGPTEVVERDGVVHVAMPVVEGPPAQVVDIELEGVGESMDDLRTVAALPPPTPYDALAVSAAVQRLRDHYLSLGYASVRVVPRVIPVGSDLHVRFVVHEGMASVVGPVLIVGLRRTHESVVRNLVNVKPGEPLDPRKLATLERRLRELGIFRRAVVTASQDTPAVIKIELEEEARYQAAYDVRYNVDEGVSALLDGEMDNVLGRGLTLGGRFRAGRTLRETRGSFHLPTIYKIGDVTGSLYQLREIVKTVRELPEGAPKRDPLELPRREQGLSVQQSIHRLHPWDLLYGYSYKRTTCPIQGLPPVSRNRRGRFDPCDSTFLGPLGIGTSAPGASTRTIDVAGIDLTAVQERRDDPLNATRGSFLSLNLKVAPGLLGGDFDFLREMVQGVFLRNVGRSIVWAQGYRIGAIQTKGDQRLPFDDLFQAGGPTTVRGFATDSLGPRTPARETIGGEGLLVMNQELRYMNDATGIGGVVFYDAGNVFARLRDVDFKLKHSVGVGLRYDSPVGLLRVDFAVPLNKRPDDRGYQLLFGIGHSY